MRWDIRWPERLSAGRLAPAPDTWSAVRCKARKSHLSSSKGKFRTSSSRSRVSAARFSSFSKNSKPSDDREIVSDARRGGLHAGLARRERTLAEQPLTAQFVARLVRQSSDRGAAV